MSLILSPDELKDLCGGRVQRHAQRAVLDHLGVPYKTRPDGSLVVFRAAAERAGMDRVAPAATDARDSAPYQVNVEALRKQHGKTTTPR